MKYKLFVFGLLLCSLMASCHPGVVIEMYNNSNQNLTAVTIDRKANETDYRAKANSSIQIAASSELRIENAGNAWQYPTVGIPTGYLEHRNSMVSVFNLQIEADGKIYALLPGMKLPTTNFPAQPKGFPLVPMRTK